jgi:hypothetical protein
MELVLYQFHHLINHLRHQEGLLPVLLITHLANLKHLEYMSVDSLLVLVLLLLDFVDL